MTATSAGNSIPHAAVHESRPATPRVGVVIPALNEALNLPHVLPHLPSLITEVVLVDGCSTDETVAVARRLRPDITIVRQRGTGKGDALRAGFDASASDILVMLDADGSMGADEIGTYVEKLLAGYDFVRGSRFLPGGRSLDITVMRHLGNKGLLWLVRHLFGGSYTDLCYGYGAFWRDMIGRFDLAVEPAQLGFEIETLLAVRAISSGSRVAEVPSVERRRIHGKSRLNPWRDGYRVLRTILREHRSRARKADGDSPSDTPDLDVSVIICAHDSARWDDLTAAIASIRIQRVPAREVIVVIDHNAALLQRVSERFPDITVVANGDARGESAARNTGLAVARGDIIAFLDDDATAADDWIAQLKRGFSDPLVMAVGGAVRPKWADTRPPWLPPEFDWIVGCTYRGMPERRSAVRNIIGCNMSFRRDVFDHGRFRTDLGRVAGDGGGCAETEFCVRIGQRWPARKILFMPLAPVFHRVPQERTRWAYFRMRCLAEGRSKARMSRISGTLAGTSVERSYVCGTLPRAICREFLCGVRADRAAFLRAGVIVAGLGLTLRGYVTGVLREWAGALLGHNSRNPRSPAT